MGAPLPTGSSLSALPVAPSLSGTEFSALAPNVGQLQSTIANGIAIGGQLARLSQLKDQLALEDAQRKADMAKAKAMSTEADLMHNSLAQKWALNTQQLQLAQTQSATDQATANARLSQVTAPADQPGSAGFDIGTNAVGSATNRTAAETNQLYANYGRNIASNMSTPGSGGDPNASAVPPGNPALYSAADGTPLDPSLVPSQPGKFEATYNAARNYLFASKRAMPSDKEIQEFIGTTAKDETYTAPDGSKRSARIIRGPDGAVWAASRPTLVDNSVATKKEQDQAASLDQTTQLIGQTDRAIAALQDYKQSGVPGISEGTKQALAGIEPGSNSIAGAFFKTPVGIVARNSLSPKTVSTAAAVSSLNAEAIKQAFGGRLNEGTLKTITDSLPTPDEIQNPDVAIGKLQTFKTQLQAAAQALAQQHGAQQMAAKSAVTPPKAGEIRYFNGASYLFDPTKNGWVKQ